MEQTTQADALGKARRRAIPMEGELMFKRGWLNACFIKKSVITPGIEQIVQLFFIRGMIQKTCKLSKFQFPNNSKISPKASQFQGSLNCSFVPGWIITFLKNAFVMAHVTLFLKVPFWPTF